MPHTFKHKFTAIGVGGDQLPQNFPIGFVKSQITLSLWLWLGWSGLLDVLISYDPVLFPQKIFHKLIILKFNIKLYC